MTKRIGTAPRTKAALMLRRSCFAQLEAAKNTCENGNFSIVPVLCHAGVRLEVAKCIVAKGGIWL